MNDPRPTDRHSDLVRRSYSQTAQSGLSNTHQGVQAVAEAFGYNAQELAAIPAEANLGLSCGNPLATANLQPGETVVDLGSGGGLDVFLAAQKVGPNGTVIGIDMTPEMIALAERNAAQGVAGRPYENVEFRLGTIDQLPLSEAVADVLISNCVINLADDKQAVFDEMFRVLKPGGRVAVSDIALKQTLPDELAASAAALVGCIAGAITAEQFQSGLRRAGFESVTVIDTHSDLNAYGLVEGQAGCCAPPTPPAAPASGSLAVVEPTGCCSPAASEGLHSDLAKLLQQYDINAYAASVRVFALKPAAAAPDDPRRRP